MSTPLAIPNFVGPFRTDFRVGLWEKLIKDKGYNISIQYNTICPCIDPETGHAVPGCSNCDGEGWYFYQTINTTGLITRQNHELDLGDQIGTAESGEAFLTILQPQMLSVFDRVTNLDSTVIYTEAIFHNRQGDSLRFVPVGNIVSAVSQTSKQGAIIKFNQGTDYTIDTNGNITWSTNVLANMVEKQTISFRYWHNPSWRVQEIINLVRDTYVIQGQPQNSLYRMPVRAKMKLEIQADK